MGESASAGTHSCFMVLFQEELLDLLVFTGSQFVGLCVCLCISVRLGVGPLLFGHSCSLLQLPAYYFGLPLNLAKKLHKNPEPRHTHTEQQKLY